MLSQDVVKIEPKSEGIATPRKKRPKELAIITECCTGCAGSPACVPYCPVADCMYWVPDEDHRPFARIGGDPAPCMGGNRLASRSHRVPLLSSEAAYPSELTAGEMRMDPLGASLASSKHSDM